MLLLLYEIMIEEQWKFGTYFYLDFLILILAYYFFFFQYIYIFHFSLNQKQRKTQFSFTFFFLFFSIFFFFPFSIKPEFCLYFIGLVYTIHKYNVYGLFLGKQLRLRLLFKCEYKLNNYLSYLDIIYHLISSLRKISTPQYAAQWAEEEAVFLCLQFFRKPN